MSTRIIPNNIIIPEIKRMIDEGRSVTFGIRGNSMRPFLEDCRDKVHLEPCHRKARRGDVLLVEDHPGHYVLHRVIKVQGNLITLKGDGNVNGTEVCRHKDIIGIATGFQRKGRTKTDSIENLKWKTYSFIWMHTTPLRRLMLALYRKIWLKIFPVKIKNQ